MPDVPPRPGDRIEYLGAPVFDGLIMTGDVGEVTRRDGDWIYATWPRSSLEHGVPGDRVRPLD